MVNPVVVVGTIVVVVVVVDVVPTVVVREDGLLDELSKGRRLVEVYVCVEPEKKT